MQLSSCKLQFGLRCLIVLVFRVVVNGLIQSAPGFYRSHGDENGSLALSSTREPEELSSNSESAETEWSRRRFLATSAVVGTAIPVADMKEAEATEEITHSRDPLNGEGIKELSIVPFSTTRQYKTIKLRNGMKVVLVSDKIVRQASAALTIGGAGQFSDPPGLSGLAHLMEHMSLSSRTSRRQLTLNKYQDFEEWLEDVDGSSNGFTAYEKVCFHFNVPIESFEESLQRFSRLFQEDIFIETCQDEQTLRREIRRVDSELIKSDSFLRELYLTKAVINPDHPYARPSAGSLETLEATPSKCGIDVSEQLVRFFKERYRPERAVLVVISPNEVSALEAWVAPFSNVLSRQRTPAIDTDQRVFPPLLPKQNALNTLCIFRKEIGNKPGDDLEKLSFQWGLNLDYSGMGEQVDRTVATGTQIGFILSQILGRRGPGSLFTLLKRRNWIPQGTQGLPKISFPVDVPGFQILRLELALTRQGFSSRSSVIAAVYDSINSLQGNPLNPFRLSRELVAEYVTVAQLYGYTLGPRPPDAVELAFDSQLYGVEGPNGVAIPSWKLFPEPRDRYGISAIQKALQEVLLIVSEPSNAIIISTASQKTIRFAEKNLLENSFPPLSPASWDISPVTGARYYSDKMFRLTGKVNEWLVAKLMEDELSPPVINPLIPPYIRPPRIPDQLGSADGTRALRSESSQSSVEQSFLSTFRRRRVISSIVAASDPDERDSILRDTWTLLRVGSHRTGLPTLSLPRAPPEPSGRSLFVLQLLSTRPARANAQMAARAELWKMSLETAMSDLAELGAPAALAYEISFNKYGMRISFLGLSQNIASYARRICRRVVEHQSRLLEGPDQLASSVVESATRSAERATNMSPQRKRQIVKILKESSSVDAAVEGIAFFKSCNGGVCFTQGDLLPKEAVGILGDLKLIFRRAIGANVRPTTAVPGVEEISYRANWIPRSASTCTVAGASLISNPCGRVPR